jgi:hypothetical protein
MLGTDDAQDELAPTPARKIAFLFCVYGFLTKALMGASI